MILTAASAPLIAVNAISSAIWVGGLVAIFVVARAASKTLDPSQRVVFFRALGRSYGVVGTTALIVALASGAALLHGHPWDGRQVAATIAAAALIIATVAGMAQARAMTRLRRQALSSPGGEDLEPRVRRGAVVAGALRGAIGLLTLALVVLGSALVA